MNLLEKVKIIYEDDDLMVLDKPAGLLVHNPMGHTDPSLIDFIVRHVPKITDLIWPDPSRPGIVHRLDKDTSGLIIVAKTPTALENLQSQFQQRNVEKQYLALVFGRLNPEQGTIIADIARHASKDRQTVIPEDLDEETLDKLAKGTIRPAQTDYETVRLYDYKKQSLTIVLAKPKTGRMHQIRIHLKHLGFPIIGDPMYFFKPSRRLSKDLGLFRQFLHAAKLNFTHPTTHKPLEFSSDLPDDLTIVLSKLTKIK